FNIQKQSDNQWLPLSHSGNTTENFFNSSVNTGGNSRNPYLKNNTGLDIAMFDIPNTDNSVITNNQTSTSFRYGSTQDTYIIFCMAMAVDAYIPEAEGLISTLSVDGISPGLDVLPGQVIEYSVEIRNKGTEPINNVVFTIPIPYTGEFVSTSGIFYEGLSG